MVLSFGAPLGHRVNQLTKASCSLLRICYALVDNNFGACLPTRRLLSSSRVLISEHRERTAQIRIGQVEIDRYKPKHPENVPANYTHQIPSQSDLRVLRWIIQKDKLAQDMFLVGPPGPEARRLGLWYAEMTGREVEVVALSKDTTESDLKQRREIKNESVLYVDQAPVRAAMKGSLLILDGIEKAERNVLPTLNNLLENREMALSDGRFLCNPDRYDKLVAEGQTVAQLDREQLVRVHPDFRVLAIGLPVPSFPGYPLDPPLRSRFQAAEVTAPTVADVLRQARPSSDYSVTHTPPIHTHTQAHSQAYTEEAAIHRERITTKGVRELIALSTSLRMAHNNSLVRTSTARPLYLSHESVMSGARVLNALAYTPLRDVIGRVYPYWAMTAEQSAAVTGALDRMLPKGDITPRYNLVGGAELLPTLDQSSQTCQAVVSMSLSTDAKGVEDTVSLVVPVGPNLKSMETPALAVPNVGDSFPNFGDTFIATPAHVQVLSDMVVDHSLGRDLCLVGGKGEGKSVLARAFGAYLGYQTETIQLFKDMTARDLLQRRSTCAVTGDTTWHDSPIVTAALSGQLAVLDGLHRLPFDTLVVLHRLIYDRELQLFDGVRLVSQNRYRTLKERCHGNQASLAQLENIVRVIHPSFRIVALANPDTGSSSKKWLQSETLPLFSFHRLPILSMDTKELILRKRFPMIDAETMESLVTISSRLQQTATDSRDVKANDLKLSMRQLVRIARHAEQFPNDLREVVERTALSRFLPTAIRDALDDTLTLAGVSEPISTINEYTPLKIEYDSELQTGVKTHVRIGEDVRHPVAMPTSPHLVPHVVFFDIPSHLRIIRDIVKDFAIGNRHVLLIGNQGTGKNKVTDRLLEVLALEREYIQLHRDTTIPSLTLAPTLHNGRVVWEDSALVRAVTHGRTLVVDEADKAPVEVVCVLKSLVEDGEMLLSDGRRIVSAGQLSRSGADENVIPIHKDFRMFVLANRPGYPFLGNDFFRECGDVFSCHVVDNPDKASETLLLQSYAPNVPKHMVSRLVEAFDEVRGGVDKGLLTYPYSTRELVNVVRHLQTFPQDSLSVALGNVFAFDQFESDTVTSIKEIMGHHGIGLDDLNAPPIGLQEAQTLARVESEGVVPFVPASTSNLRLRYESDGIDQPLTRRNMSYQFGNRKSSRIEAENKRITRFTEQTWGWQLEMGENSDAKGMQVTSDGVVHVLQDRPWALHSLNGEGYTESAYLDLGFIPTTVDAELSRVPVNTQTVSEDLDGRVSSSSVLVSVLPSSQLFKVTPLTGDCVGYTLPDVFRGPPVRMQLLYARPKQTDLKLASPTTGSNFGVYEIGKPDFLVLDLETERWSHFFVEDLEGNPEAVASVKSLSANMLSITTTGGGIVMLDTETKEMRTLAQPLGEWEDSVVATELAAPHETYGAWLEPIQGRLHSSVTSGDSSSASPRTFVTHKHDISSADLPPAWDGATFLALHTHGMPQSNMQGTVSALIGSPDKVSVVDLASNHLRYLNIATNGNEQNLTEGKDTQEDPLAGLSPLPWLHQQMGQVVTVQRSGYVRMWEVDEDVLKDGLDTWMTMMGVQHNQPLTLSITEEEPEHNIHGKESSVSNPKNRSKMGAMPGAGRTGGGGDEAQKGGGGGGGGEGGASGTGAGGGEGADKKSDGFGGYQRDDSGQIQLDETHDAAEVQEMALKALDPEVRKQLTKMKKTKNIHGRYQNILEVVQRPIKQLRVVLESVRAKEKEREWINNQNQGDLDDAKLLDGLLGEENIYKRRGEPDQQMGLHQAKPKRMAFVVDLSASMSRFNDWDKRLDRLADAMVMVMESLAGSEHKYHYSIVGHSGSTPTIPLVAYGKPPANENERMDVVSKMYGYAGGSVSGDNTLNAARIAVEEVTAEEADDYYVFVVSDANVGRYDITPTTFGAILSKDERVNAYAIFIAERGAADYLINGLPFGHGFVCEETETLPTVFKDIFTRATMDD